jgi:uncharacterized protein YecT (DUF1311 family)
VLIWAMVMICAIFFIRGADARLNEQVRKLERREKKRMRTPAAH